MRTRVIHEFAGFPDEIAIIIADYCAKPELLDWIPQNRLNINLAANPMAWEAGMVEINSDNADSIARNTAADAEIQSNPMDYFCHDGIWSNPCFAEELLKSRKKPCKWWISQNPHPLIVAHMIKHPELIDDKSINCNPGAKPS